ncbi:discoidin domain-containing protein [Paenibacillus sp. Soil787]|uniref:discoidin domain-containing protein n=1 Tax=Paenibacillus sp. Soil787 TaxID=1736411 RepID=UPI000703A0D4|nr:discoidin domain-containing protein [Paenibacillus sp. Soil787]KRF21505.1 hypothetical protein ASG93_09040 [Paenibacillus sp. Soil787]
MTKWIKIALSFAIVLFSIGYPHGEKAEAAINSLAPTPYMGWNEYFGLGGANLTESTMKSVTDFIVSSGLKDFGYNIVWLDGGWWTGARDGNGNITDIQPNFPSGMAALATYIHNAGLKAGMYTDAGATGCGTAGGSGGHYQQDMNTFAAWGYDIVKVDWCGSRNVEHFDNKIAYAAVRDAVLNNSSGRPMILNLCDWSPLAENDSWEFGPYTANSWRTEGDIATHTATWSGIVRNFDSNSAHPGSNGPGHWNDPDYLQVHQSGITDYEAQSQFSLWAMMASPLIIGGDVRAFTPAQMDIVKNTEVIAIDQDPLGVQAIKVDESTPGLQVWSKKLNTAGTRAVALFNRNSAAANITVTASQVGLTGSFAVRDLWEHANKGTFSSYTVNVPSHGVVMLNLTGGTENYTTYYAVNAGGSAQGSFIADTNTVDGTQNSVVNTISTTGVTNPAPAAVYQSARVGNATVSASGATQSAMQYYIPQLQPGSIYTVRLHFAENWNSSAEARKFDVRINGNKVLTDFDVYAEAGFQQYKAVVREFTTVASQGFVTVDFSAGSASVPIISGIEVIAGGSPPPPPAPTPNPINLAIGAAASASSQVLNTYAAYKANDGDSTTTRWLANAGSGVGEWLQLDFGSNKTFNTTRLKEGNNRISGYKIQYLNGSTWTDLISNGTTIGTGKTDTFPAVTASKIRLYVTATVINNGSSQPSIWEFGVYNNLALGATASASSQWDNILTASKANDGSMSTRWNSASGTRAGEWLQIDFGQPTTFNQVVTREQSYQRITGYKIQYFNGSSWIDLASGTTVGSNRLNSFTAVTANKVRFYVTSAANVPTIDEFEVYNQ